MPKPLSKDVSVGTIHKTKSYGDVEVIEVTNSYKIKVRFIDTGYEITTGAGNIRKGSIKDKLSPTVYGVGFIGDGEFKVSEMGSHTHAYRIWGEMLKRCYCDKYQSMKPTYKECITHPEWHNFQNFAGWFYINYPKDGKKYQLDKDLKVIGNKVYAHDKCMFVSGDVNAFTTDHAAGRGNCIIGVTYNKRNKKFHARCSNSISGEEEHLGFFGSEIEAHKAWRNRKSELAYELATIQSSQEVKSAILRWKDALDKNLIHTYFKTGATL